MPSSAMKIPAKKYTVNSFSSKKYFSKDNEEVIKNITDPKVLP
jgi:hypothetical protein